MVLPQSNVPPASQPWARAVESLINQGAIDLSSLQRDNVAGFQAVNSSLASIQGQIASINANAAATAAQQTQINNLVATQIIPDSFYNSASGITIGSTTSVLVSQTITVPATYTKAAVILQCAVTMVNTSGSLNYLATYGAITGGTGAIDDIGSIGVGVTARTNPAYTRTLTGLTGGGTFQVWCQGVASTSSTNAANFAAVNGIILWFR